MTKACLLPIALVILAFPVMALASNRANVSASELAHAINEADSQYVPYRQGKISPSDIRNIRCIGPNEEPTEFECKWQQSKGHRWVARKTWLETDSRGWHVMDA